MKSKQYVHEAEKIYEGVIPALHRAMEKSVSSYRQKKIEENFMEKVICPDCDGFRINQQARETLLNERHIGQLALLSVKQLITFLESIPKSSLKTVNGRAILNKIQGELSKFELIGLSYLHLNRGTRTLSGGENQRLNLMTQINLGLGGVILILDEPTIGLHEIEKKNLGEVLQDLRNQGNTVIIVEHDEGLISLTEEIIDLGPNAGVEGGEIVFQGTVEDLKREKKSLTGKYLNGTLSHPQKSASSYRKWDSTKTLKLSEISTNNLKNISLTIPLGVMVGIAGVSGSGKSSLISDTLVPLLQKQIKQQKKQEKLKKKQMSKTLNSYNHDVKDPLEVIKGYIEGWEHIDECIIVDQSPIGRNRNSFPASYIGLWDEIRKLYSKLPVAKEKKYKEGHFSFNSERGRCPTCKGEGRINLQISFLDEISILCEECEGNRYLPEILGVIYKGLSIRDMLDLSVKDSIKIFEDQPNIAKYLKILDEIGMGYITLGQSARTLSGGEAQRIKLARALGSSKKKNSLFVMDEPTTGLHFHDEVKLLKLLDNLVEQGNSVIIIEHNTKILSYCDWLIELGPGGGPQGGEVISQGLPADLKKDKHSRLGEFLVI
jgi:excinuclease ABC A subunit